MNNTVDNAPVNLNDTARNYRDLEVAGEPGVYWCARHKNVQTRLRCGRCETPICPKCTRIGPTGARCQKCLSNRSQHIYQLSTHHIGMALITSLVLGSLGGWLSRWPLIGFFVIFYALGAGTLIGRAVTRVTGGKRGTVLAIIAVAGIVLGALLPINVLWHTFALSSQGVPVSLPLFSALNNPFAWLYAGLASAGAWYWLK